MKVSLVFDKKHFEGIEKLSTELDFSADCGTDDICLDELVVSDGAMNYNSLEGELHICFHPAYAIPCPYIRIWSRLNGSLLS